LLTELAACSQMPPKAAACRWSWDIRGMDSPVSAQVRMARRGMVAGTLRGDLAVAEHGGIGPADPMGKMLFNILATFAEMVSVSRPTVHRSLERAAPRREPPGLVRRKGDVTRANGPAAEPRVELSKPTHCAGGDQPVRSQPPGQEPDQRGEDRAVGPVRPGPRMGAAQHGDLVPQHEQLGVLGG